MTFEQRTLLRLGDDMVVVKTDTPEDGDREKPRLYVASSMAKQIGAGLSYAQVEMLHDTLGNWLAAERLNTPGKDYDHEARPDDDPEPGDRCKDCGEDITWIGPLSPDYLHVDDKENR